MVGCGIIIMFVGGRTGRNSASVYQDEINQWDDDKEEWILTGRMIKGRSTHAVSIVTMDDDLINYCN